MKDRGTFALLAFFFAGLIGLWVADFVKVPTRAQIDRMSTRVLSSLIDSKPDDLRKVEILGGLEPLVFERRDGNRWQMTSPVDVAADPSKVETLAYNLKELSRRPDSATLEPDLARYGLDHPDRTIKLWGLATDAPLATLEVGRASLDRRYVRAGGSEGVEVVDARGLDQLRLPAIQWRDRELFRVPSFEVDAVTLEIGSRSLKLRRRRGSWQILADPVRLLAAEARVDGLVADLGSLRVVGDDRFVANDVEPADLDRFGLKTPAMTIQLESTRVDRRRAPQVLQIGKPVEGKDGLVYAKRGDQDDVVILESRVLNGLKPEVNAFRSPKVADFNPSRVLRVGVKDAEGVSLEVGRFGNDWSIIGPSSAKGDRQAIQDFLKSLDQLQTGIFLTAKEIPDSGVDQPSLTLKVWEAPDQREPSTSGSADPNGELAVHLKIGRRDAGRKVIYAQIEGDSTILALPDSANDFLPRNPLAFRDRQILGLDVDRLEQIKLEGPTRKITLNAPVFKVGQKKDLGLAPSGWWMVNPIQAPADSASIGKLLKLLANLRADSLVGEIAPGQDRYGLATPALTVTWSAFSMIERPSRPEPTAGAIPFEHYSMKIGAAVPNRPNTRFAKLDNASLVFTLGPEVLSVLDSEYRDHRILSFDPDHVRRVRLAWPDRELVLAPAVEVSGRGWRLVPDSDAPEFDPAPLKPLLETASKLTTLRFAQYQGSIPPGFGLTPPRLAIGFEFDDDSRTRTLQLGASVGNGQLLATVEDGSEGPVVFLPEAMFGPLLKAPRRSDDLPDNVFAP